MFEDTASALFGVEGLQVTGVEAAPDGVIEVWAVTDWQAARTCPDCGTVSDRVHETVVTRPRDVRRAGDAVDLRWVKVRRKCGNQQCPRKTFTEWVPALPPRCRITSRLREQAAHEVTGQETPACRAASAGVIPRSATSCAACSRSRAVIRHRGGRAGTDSVNVLRGHCGFSHLRRP